MPHVTADPDWPPLFLQVHEDLIKAWVGDALANRSSDHLRVLPRQIALRGPRPGSAPASGTLSIIEMQLMHQMHAKTGETRIVVQPVSREDVDRAREWARRHEGFLPTDFTIARSVARG